MLSVIDIRPLPPAHLASHTPDRVAMHHAGAMSAPFGEEPCAIDNAVLHQRAETALARPLWPRHYQHMTTLPRAANGKPIRRAPSALHQRRTP
jgi:hypothetical protein